MAAFKHLPDFVMVGRQWTIKNFDPLRAASMFEHHQGKVRTLYVLECAGCCKIGITENFEKRLRDLDFANPLPVRKVATRRIQSSAVGFAEAYLHDKFKEFRIKGEWFRIDPKTALAALPEVVKRAAIYHQYCHAWHIEATKIRASDEYQAKARREHREFLEESKALYAKRIIELQAEADDLLLRDAAA